eukprot:114133_1
MKVLLLFPFLCALSSALCTTSPSQSSKNTAFFPKSYLAKTFGVLSISSCILASSSLPANAADYTKGEDIFQANCSMCHAGGKNVIVKSRTLEKDALEKIFDLSKPDEISNFVKTSDVHRGALVFAGRMTDKDYTDVANYVINQAMEEKW